MDPSHPGRRGRRSSCSRSRSRSRVAAVNVFYRDVGNLARHVLRFWFYLSPVLYSADLVLNSDIRHREPVGGDGLQPQPVGPPAGVVPRICTYYGTAPDWLGLAVLSIISVFLIAGAILCSSGSSRPSRRSCEPSRDTAGRDASRARGDPRRGAWRALQPQADPEADRPGFGHPARPRGRRHRVLGAAARLVQRRNRASPSASSGRTAPARARCSRCSRASSRRPRASSRSTATSRAC